MPLLEAAVDPGLLMEEIAAEKKAVPTVVEKETAATTQTMGAAMNLLKSTGIPAAIVMGKSRMKMITCRN